ncbi:hypothetical protein [Granulicella aggregans]|uniref:hypothetical protein n=1 Tax=Granulicella aggregans TaxID=474949 RepID=UPI0021E032CC|nr:hypothetical protein [Granulicella aggregans]
MRIDETHRPWLWFSIALLAVSTAIYVPYANMTTPAGSTAIGLTFGVIALGFMVFAALLAVRKRYRIIRIGSARVWMKAHLWLGTLALPMVLFHAAFHARGLLAFILMTLTFIVVFSGIYGAYLQHTLPTRMFREVPYETIYDQIGVIREQLIAEARQHATNVTQMLAPARGPGATVTMTLVEIPEYSAEVASFDRFFESRVEPYLRADGKDSRSMDLRHRANAEREFEDYRKLFPSTAWQPISALEEICNEKRQLDHQVRLHHWLHGWLLIHLPISAALLLLAFIHAVVALHY